MIIKHNLTKPFALVYNDSEWFEKGFLGNTLCRSDMVSVKDFDTEEEIEVFIEENGLTEYSEYEV